VCGIVAGAGNNPRGLPVFSCPVCRHELEQAHGALACRRCARRFPIIDGVAVLTAGEAEGHKLRQAVWFDEQTDDEFEITRPHGTPALYEWYYRNKFARSVSTLSSWVGGSMALTVCGGSGMDAEFLARSGATVICSDISLGAAGRATERAARYGLAITPIVAEAERLPFGDQAVDFVFVHDGLHHLPDPLAGVREMARVSRCAVSISEPARAAVTAVAVALGLAREFEDAGNRVARLTPAEVVAVLREDGFVITRAQRYAMYHRHEPGRVIAALSAGPTFAATKVAVRAFNALAGCIGNKLTVQAVRIGAP
jgi:SAM-dependent methyltransferase